MTPEFIPWPEFYRELRWQQGEHVSLVGPTGGGKTTLALALLHKREWICALGTKPEDPTLERLRRAGFVRRRSWPPPAGARRVLLWPRYERMEDIVNQRDVMREALREMFALGAWCVFADEAYWLCRNLGLEAELRQYWMQGRSIKLSLVAATQRPAWVPLEMYSQATHVFFWRTSDRRDLDRIAGLGGIDPQTIRASVRSLRKNHALYVNTRTGAVCVTKAPAPGG